MQEEIPDKYRHVLSAPEYAYLCDMLKSGVYGSNMKDVLAHCISVGIRQAIESKLISVREFEDLDD